LRPMQSQGAGLIPPSRIKGLGRFHPVKRYKVQYSTSTVVPLCLIKIFATGK
jgi:hypothetical protein